MTMQKLGAVRRALAAGELDGAMTRLLYGDLTDARRRVSELLDGFQHTFGAGEDTLVALCSAPGRTEICGNHTDQIAHANSGGSGDDQGLKRRKTVF